MVKDKRFRKQTFKIGRRNFTIWEMSCAELEVFYGAIRDLAKASDGGFQSKTDQLNHRLWQMMLHPMKGQEPITTEWIDRNTNSQLMDKVVRIQMELNKF